MRKIAILAFTFLFACRLDAQIMRAQQQIDGVLYPVVIDNSAMSTKTKKTAAELQGQRVSATNWAMKPHLENGEINQKVSPFFAVSPKDIGDYLNWEQAQIRCTQYLGPLKRDSEAGKWRLPTQREMIWLFILGAMDADLSTPGYTPFAGTQNYWCATGYSDNLDRAWYLLTTYGSTENGLSKTTIARVRCIRDL